MSAVSNNSAQGRKLTSKLRKLFQLKEINASFEVSYSAWMSNVGDSRDIFTEILTKLNNVERKTLVRARVNLEVSARNSVVGID